MERFGELLKTFADKLVGGIILKKRNIDKMAIQRIRVLADTNL